MEGRDGMGWDGMGWDGMGWDGMEGKGSGEGNEPGTVIVRHLTCMHNMPRCMKLALLVLPRLMNFALYKR